MRLIKNRFHLNGLLINRIFYLTANVYLIFSIFPFEAIKSNEASVSEQQKLAEIDVLDGISILASIIGYPIITKKKADSGTLDSKTLHLVVVIWMSWYQILFDFCSYKHT